jgi:hypothetical protein
MRGRTSEDASADQLSAMPKQDNRKTRKKAYEVPRLAIGDVLLVGKFKNRKPTITGFTSDENKSTRCTNRRGRAKDL